MTVLKHLRFFRQHKDYTCGPASLKMAFDFFGIHKKETTLSKEANTHKNGTAHKDLVRTARRNGFYCHVHENSCINEIRYFIERDLPVIINYREPSSEEGHYSVVVGHNKHKIILDDPWNGKRFTLNVNKFLKRWDKKYHKWIVVLSKKKINMGQTYPPIKKR